MTRHFYWLRRGKLAVCATFLSLLVISGQAAHGQLRIVSYNTAAQAYVGSGTNRIETVLKAIGEETRNGFAKPIDVLLLQEQSLPANGAGPNNPSPTTQALLSLLNTAYSGQGVTYAMSNRTGFTSGSNDPSQSLIYRTETVSLLADTAFGSGSQPRQTLRYQLRPVGYSSAADFYAYNSHFKASLDSSPPGSNANQRNVEAVVNRGNADGLGEGAHIIYAGDLNLYYSDSREPAWATLVAPGAGQANDPINTVGSWHTNASFAAVHTQSPCTSSVGNCGVTGGMDDRFDFQLVSGEFLDAEGFSYLSGSYHAFGNNGTTFNANINAASNTVTFPGVTSYTKPQILNALHEVTDHIPVVADYQIPAWMQAVADSVPAMVDVGQVVNVGVTVSNIAPVIAVIGADELDYSLTTSGSISGSFLNQMDAALGSGNMHNVSLNTSTLGAKTGTITVTSTSQGVQNGLINIPVSFTVVLPGDYNGNNSVDAADYAIWRKTLGQSVPTGTGADGSRDGTVGPEDLTVWRAHFGQSASGAGSGLSAVPEPSAATLLLLGVCVLGRRVSKLKG
jgi:hypothetical protein